MQQDFLQKKKKFFAFISAEKRQIHLIDNNVFALLYYQISFLSVSQVKLQIRNSSKISNKKLELRVFRNKKLI